jgi:hypothetical protein
MLAAIAAALLLQVAAPASDPPSTPVAERLAKATSLPDDELFVSLQTNLPAARRKALEAAMSESKALAADLRTTLADAYARHLTTAEMEEAVAFFESPIGASFERKSLKRQADSITPDEARAADAFVRTPAGMAFKGSEQAIGEELLPAVQILGQTVLNRAQEIYCRDTKECGAFIP